jgi:biotin carboxyl carrier protein
MKLHLHLEAGSKVSEHRLELTLPEDGRASDGPQRFTLDGEQLEAEGREISPGVYSILLGGRSFDVHINAPPGSAANRQGPYAVQVGLRRYQVTVPDSRSRRRGSVAREAEGPQDITAPMPGKVVKILVEENQQVKRDASLLVIEAMKMQNELRAPRNGRVEKIFVGEGAGVESGCKLLRLV